MLRATLALVCCACCFLPSWADSFLEFHSADGERELIPVSPQHPAPLCLRQFEQPPYYAWPVIQVYLLLRLDGKESNSTSVLSWIPWVGQPSRLQIQVKKGPPRWFCRLGQSWLAAVLPSMCKDCTQRCAVKPIQWADNLAVPIPSSGGCVYISKFPPNVDRVHASWYLHLDLSVFIFLLLGIVFVFAWKPLRESVAFHAGLGGVGSLIFITLMVLLWLSRSVRGTLHGSVPFGRSLTTLLAGALAFIPAARNALLAWTLRWLPAPNWQSWLGLKDPIFDLPIGWLAFLLVIVSCLVLVHLGAKLSVRYFAASPEPEGDIDFIIGGDGRRVDLLPPVPVSQRMLGWGIWLLGVSFLLCSTHSDTCSLLITLVVLFKDYIEHVVRMWMMWRSVDVQPKDIRSLISSDEMHSQASATTKAALAQLQQYVKEHPRAVLQVREDSELKLRRFREDGAHFRQPLISVSENSSSLCLVQ
ncbi:unnamed protein product [Durusdinium trenchii]|uniref:Uncharacterized protein n=1 Tax=Durusdinium trenchii TaxID=1381693 RepID=A0ABP0R1M1_9DINO